MFALVWIFFIRTSVVCRVFGIYLSGVLLANIIFYSFGSKVVLGNEIAYIKFEEERKSDLEIEKEVSYDVIILSFRFLLCIQYFRLT